MRLEVNNFKVKNIEFSTKSGLEDGVLFLNSDITEDLKKKYPVIQEINLDIARPGESVRIINPLDAVEPIAKYGPSGFDVFPGFIGPSKTVGHGITHRLKGMRIIQCAKFPQDTTGVLTVRPAIIDMSGPAAPMCACSDSINLVLSVVPKSEASNHEFDVAIRMVNLRLAHFLAKMSFDQTPDEKEVFEIKKNGKPRIVHICQVQDQGELVQTMLYGQTTRMHTPTILSPNELIDGAIVSGNYKNAMKIPTYLHSRNPVCMELFDKNNKEICFAGVILTRGHNDTHSLKERSAYYAAKLAKILKADGAIVSLEGTGNTMVDAMLTVRACEEAGIKTVLKIHEHAGRDGGDWPLVDFVKEANAIVSIGNLDEALKIPTADKVIGPKPLKFYGLPEVEDPGKGAEITGHELFSSEWQMGTSGYSSLAL